MPAAESTTPPTAPQATTKGPDDETRQRLVEATTRCIAARGSVRMTVADVAVEAGVARSTVYRYFPTRDDLLLGVLVSRIDASVDRQVAALGDPDDAVGSIAELVLGSIELVGGDPVNEALFSAEGRWVVTALEFGAEPVVDAVYRHLRPLLERWQADGQLHPDLDLRETARWINAVSNLMLSPPLAQRSAAAKRLFLDHYLLRALVPAGGAEWPPSRIRSRES
ncbi:TetR/AcrR family transcriptional regulator [Trujillonella endophytica]|uniref:Transcriptional regulator, TetR family n=1 Tax=Trujillonella endophytica TaxID=673521 RepID=A0A1H8Q4R5_9ACTN|nr:TetR/AcrR family transcriptional regulator [Trujillella endophytica]SEO49056.1 transcriptional regulator, TetR family [Trujillella endophytica]